MQVTGNSCISIIFINSLLGNLLGYNTYDSRKRNSKFNLELYAFFFKSHLFKEAGSVHKYLQEHAKNPTKPQMPEGSKTKDCKIKCRAYFIQILGFLVFLLHWGCLYAFHWPRITYPLIHTKKIFLFQSLKLPGFCSDLTEKYCALT